MHMNLNRRDFLRTLAAVATAAALPAAGCQSTSTGARQAATDGGPSHRRPNIIVIMADDMGFSDIGCYGAEIATPNLDRLAQQGMRFTQFYNTARCCPTRASILTGLYAHQAGVGHMVGNRGVPGYEGYLNDRCVTIAEVLRQAGYRTLMSGKWHVGGDRPHWPTDRGFEHYFGLLDGASSYFELDKGRTMAVNDQPYTPPSDGFYMTDAFTDRAVNYIDEFAGKPEPFFLYVAYTAPHWPVHALPEDIEKYKGKYTKGWDELRKQRHQRMIDMGLVDARWPLSPRDDRAPAWDTVEDKAAEDLKMAAYAAQIDRMDQGIGKILAKLKETGADQNTLVLFLSDNGGCAEAVNRGDKSAAPGTRESYIAYGLPWANASNTPLRLYKQRVHEGGIASPLVAWWPGQVPAGKITHQVGHVIDLMPTCLAAAGVSYPSTHNGRPITPVAGKSLLSVLQGGSDLAREPIFWEHQGNRAVRQGPWKLVALYQQPWELYHLDDDRTELHNLAEKHPEKAAELLALYDRWAKNAGVVPFESLPRNRPTTTTRAAEQ